MIKKWYLSIDFVYENVHSSQISDMEFYIA
jgi:hypothetical protein